MPHTRGKPPVRLPHVTSGSDRLLLSDHLSDLHIDSPNPNANPTRTRYGAEPAWEELTSSEMSRSGFGGILFSGRTTVTTAVGTTGSSGVAAEMGKRKEEESWARRAKESYYLQLSLAARVMWHAFLGDDRNALVQESSIVNGICCGGGGGGELYSDSVSYRLWVNGCLPFSDKITDGFYNIMGMDPFLWAMCNELEEGKKLPTLLDLRAVDPSESSMEVILVDKSGDPGLKILEDKALEYHHASGLSLELVGNLARLVSSIMGGAFETEQGDLYRQWKSCSKQLRKLQQCIVIPIGSLSFGLCRHRAILFKIDQVWVVARKCTQVLGSNVAQAAKDLAREILAPCRTAIEEVGEVARFDAMLSSPIHSTSTRKQRKKKKATRSSKRLEGRVEERVEEHSDEQTDEPQRTVQHALVIREQEIEPERLLNEQAQPSHEIEEEVPDEMPIFQITQVTRKRRPVRKRTKPS